MMSSRTARVCVVLPIPGQLSETFLRAHTERLPAEITVVHGQSAHVGDSAVLSNSLICRAIRKVVRIANHRSWDSEIFLSFFVAFRRHRPDVVLAEYGPVGVRVMEACKLAKVPLVVHFHGYDASHHDTLRQYRDQYREMFREAQAVVAVSRAMERTLLSLGAPRHKLYYNPYGIDCNAFSGAAPEQSAPVFLTVGRFTDKKAPQITLLAFQQVIRELPNARLRMIGDGPLLGACMDLARALDVAGATTFLGVQPPNVVREEMRCARCFVQHSITAAATGDSEGTPVAILEAGATGLPVVSTRHAGICDVVVEEETGLLVDEYDVEGMARNMLRIGRDPQLAAQMGVAARNRIKEHFSLDQSIAQLWHILESCIDCQTDDEA